MWRGLLLGFCLAIAGSAPALTAINNTIILDEDEVKACKEGGGCYVVPEDKLKEVLQKAIDDAKAEACPTPSRLHFPSGAGKVV